MAKVVVSFTMDAADIEAIEKIRQFQKSWYGNANRSSAGRLAVEMASWVIDSGKAEEFRQRKFAWQKTPVSENHPVAPAQLSPITSELPERPKPITKKGRYDDFIQILRVYPSDERHIHFLDSDGGGVDVWGVPFPPKGKHRWVRADDGELPFGWEPPSVVFLDPSGSLLFAGPKTKDTPEFTPSMSHWRLYWDELNMQREEDGLSPLPYPEELKAWLANKS